MMTASDYVQLYADAKITTDAAQVAELDSATAEILAHRALYDEVAKATTVPWYVVAAIHYRECNLNFNCHLHNGDPLTAKTVRVPAGCPAAGCPPFTWQASAIDAINRPRKPQAWDIAGCLDFMERYNGPGYRKHGINTPYLWSYTSQYQKGLYVKDGMFDPEAVNRCAGTAAILKTLSNQGVKL